jgi:hypothetical protein
MRKLLAGVVRLNEQLEAELSAAKVDDLVAAQPERESDIRALNAADPSRTKKYLSWGVGQLGRSNVEDIIAAIREFDAVASRLAQKDINNYASVSDVKSAVASAAPTKRSKEQNIKGEANILLDTDRWLLVHPQNREASCIYGRGTKWCIASTGAKRHYWNNYLSSNTFFYFLIDKQGSSVMSRLAIALIKGKPSFLAFWDAKDDMASEEDVEEYINQNLEQSELESLSGSGNSYDKIIQVCRAHCEAQPDTWQYTLVNSLDEKKVERLFFEHNPEEELIQSRLARSWGSTGIPVAMLEALRNSPHEYVREIMEKSDKRT